MNPFRLVLQVLRLLKASPGNPPSQPTLPRLPVLLQLCESPSFQRQTGVMISLGSAPTSKLSLLKQLIVAYKKYFFVNLLLSLLCMGALILQPYINGYLREQISRKFQQEISGLVLECVLLFGGYKLVTSCLYVLEDFCGMIFGVKMYSAVSFKLVGMADRDRMLIDGKFVAAVEDDCQRLQNIPASTINSLTKILQFLIFSSLLISQLPAYSAPIAISYYLFLLLSILLAIYSSTLNLKILQSKQKRLQFTSETTKEGIQAERDREIGSIKYLMAVEGVGLILPWLINVVFMVVVYGLVGMDKDQRYFVLIVFGLLRGSISGLGTNMNYFAQAWSSLQRISNFINQSSSQKSLNQPILPSKVQTSPSSPNLLPSPQPTLRTILKLSSGCTPQTVPLLVLLGGLLFTANFMYSYCAKSILMGQSIFTFFNLLTLALELLAPILLYWFVCWCNLGMSRAVYQGLLTRDLKDLVSMSSQELNRLSGDIRLLDRQLYFCTYGSISHITGIAASFLYSIVILNNVFSSILLTIIICFSIWLAYLCQKFIAFRKQCYRKQATNKGGLLQALFAGCSPIKKWRNIYTYKCFGFGIELTFISILYLIMILVSTLILVVVMLSSAPVEDSSVLVMLISQLDSQFLVLFVQVMILQTTFAAVARCFGVIGQRKGEESDRDRVVVIN